MSRKFLIFLIFLILILLLITASIDLSIASAEAQKRMASETAEPEETEADLKEFQAAIENMNISWNADDPRTEAERLKALFEFMTETYAGVDAFGISQSALKGNLITRSLWGDLNQIIGRQIGLVLWPENEKAPAYGMSPSQTSDQSLVYTSNCLMCHMAEIDGVAYFGAGNKIFDEKKLVDMAIKATNSLGRTLIKATSQEKEKLYRVNQILKSHRHDKTNPLTRGRSTAFVRSHIELYRGANSSKLPPTAEVGRGDSKVPPLWHYIAKRDFQRWYLDGSFRGDVPMMASSMELAKGRSMRELDEMAIPKIKEQFESLVAYIRPPKYPYDIDANLAEKGKALFYSEEIGCYKCHGSYDRNGNVHWTGAHVNVGTDETRLEIVSDGYIEAFNHSPLASEFKLIKSEGYAAVPLTGVWANFPYLHNGSVPTLYHLLSPQAERPKIFHVLSAKHFDPEKVGQKLFPDDLNQKVLESKLMKKYGDNRDWFNVDRKGCKNVGHDFWSRIKTDSNRKALIEYLKTL